MSIARLSARHLSTWSGGLFPISARASALLEGDGGMNEGPRDAYFSEEVRLF